jgi:hypothetical protein
MATVRSATASANAPASGHGFAGSKKTAYGKYAYTTAGPLGGDTIVMCRLPKGAVILGGRFRGRLMESTTSSATLDIDIGITSGDTDTDAFGNLGVLSGAAKTGIQVGTGYNYAFGGVLLSDGPLTLTKESEIGLTVVTSSFGFVSSVLSLEVDYVLP